MAFNAWEVRRRPLDLLAAAAAATYVVLLAGNLLGRNALPGGAYFFWLPAALAPLLLLRRSPLPPVQGRAILATVIALLAYLGAIFAPTQPLIVFALPAVLAVAVIAVRHPAGLLTIALACTGAFGSLKALFDVPAAQLADLMLVGLWVAAVWGWCFGEHLRSRPAPALFALALYVAFSASQILTAETLTIGLQAFRGSVWYLAVLLLAAYAPWGDVSRDRMLRGAALVGLAIGGYATLRWVIGPAGAERDLAATNANNVLDGELRPVGSFSTSKELAAWTAMFTPFLFGLGLVWRGRWRLIAFTAAGACVMGMLAADVRAGPAAAAPALAAVLALYQLSQAFRGRRGPAVLVIVLVALVGGAGAFAVTLGDKQNTSDRYENILNPTRDASYQARIVKWRTALDDIERAPLGNGLGTAGRTQKRFGIYANIGTIDVDNSYLLVAYQQGFIVMVILFGTLALILLWMIRVAVTSPDPRVAGPLIAACGTFIAMLVIFWVGDYVEGLPALGGWLLVGLGLGALTRSSMASDSATGPAASTAT